MKSARNVYRRSIKVKCLPHIPQKGTESWWVSMQRPESFSCFESPEIKLRHFLDPGKNKFSQKFIVYLNL